MTLPNLLHASRTRRTHNGLGHGCAVHHFLDGNRKGRPAAGGFRECIQSDAADVECLGLPDFGLALCGLKLARAEQPSTSFLGRSAGNVRHAFQTDPALRTENLETESRTGGREGSEISGHAVLHSEQYRGGIVAIDLDSTPETLAENMIDRATEIDHAIDR